jgi:hypothetical protein
VRYVVRLLRKAGWRVRLQQVPMRVPSEPAPARLTVPALGELKPIRDFRVPTFSGGGHAGGPVAPVGSGCRPDEFEGLEAGSVAVAGRGGCFVLVKARNAARAGASALLVAGLSDGHGLPSVTLGSPARLPVLLVGRRVARALEPGTPVSLRVSSGLSRSSDANVIAEAGKGTRVVMAGAHLDSVPDGAGINDNGSGVATLLEAAEALGPHPNGRVRLAFWAGEELGLVGSSHYVRTLSGKGREEIAAYLNLDMVGSPNALPAVYSDGDERLEGILRESHPGREAGVAAGGRSDHAAFERAGTPVNGYYTGSEEDGPGDRPRDPCYHRPCDTLHNVDRQVLLSMARATVAALREIEDEP